MSETTAGQCPVVGAGRVHPTQGNANTEWWPSKLNLKILARTRQVSNPLDEDFDYTEAFSALTWRPSRPIWLKS
ncbi:hypothetical protein ACPROK_09925 [Glutamicibacter soli]|uniref:hypothetical protein n=1 Tax=Glutamicibacter soli TaxID=453836 RepID=UPI003C742936